MTKVVRKSFFIWDFDKHEKWLNEMAEDGWCLVARNGWKHEFEQCQPGEYIFRIELLKHKYSHSESEKYLAFLKEAGIVAILPKIDNRWIFLRKKKDDGDFELYSDNASRIKYLNRVLRNIVFLFVSCIYFICLQLPNLINLLNEYEFDYFAPIVLLFLYIFAVLILLVTAILSVYGFIKTYKKRKKLKAEQKLFE